MHLEKLHVHCRAMVKRNDSAGYMKRVDPALAAALYKARYGTAEEIKALTIGRTLRELSDAIRSLLALKSHDRTSIFVLAKAIHGTIARVVAQKIVDFKGHHDDTTVREAEDLLKGR